jgi:lipoprotein-anchoring transpeptidase ErfK/SrfK
MQYQAKDKERMRKTSIELGYRALVRPLLVLLLVSAVTGCGGRSGDAAAPLSSEDVSGAKKTAAICRIGITRPLGSSERSYAAVVQERATAYREPGGAPLSRFGSENANGVPTVFQVRAQRLASDCRPAWFHVQLPLKPNGTTGWVRAEDVELAAVTTRVVVDLSDRTVTLYERGRRVLRTHAAIGKPATPTPTGRYYVNQRLVPADPSGPFGPGAIGISAFSEVLTGWTQGGPIAIHGTDRPQLIGQAVSTGCVRVRNEVLRTLFARTRAGTPVTVRA